MFKPYEHKTSCAEHLDELTHSMGDAEELQWSMQKTSMALSEQVFGLSVLEYCRNNMADSMGKTPLVGR